MGSREDAQETWIKDGTVDMAPVTDTTPIIDTTPVVPAVVEVAPVAPAVAEPSVSTPATPETVAAAAVEQEEFIEGMYKGQAYKIPKFVELPLERKGVKTFATIEKIRAEGMMDQDYRIKTAEAAEIRRQADLATRAANARANEAEKIALERAEQAKAAMGSPEEREKFEGFVHQYNTNEVFKKMVDDARDGRLNAAETAVYTQEQVQEVVNAEVASIKATIAETAKKYPYVDPEAVRETYSRALQSETPPPISPEAVEYFFQQENEKAKRIVSPFESQLGELKAQIAAMQAAAAATTHNSKTERQIARAVNPVAVPANGAPPAPVVPKVTGKTLEERTNSWLTLSA